MREAAHQYINAAVSLESIQEDMKVLPRFPGLINNSLSWDKRHNWNTDFMPLSNGNFQKTC